MRVLLGGAMLASIIEAAKRIADRRDFQTGLDAPGCDFGGKSPESGAQPDIIMLTGRRFRHIAHIAGAKRRLAFLASEPLRWIRLE
jgi:hypothetical protein